MGKGKTAASFVCSVALAILTACGGSAAPASTVAEQAQPAMASVDSAAAAAATSTAPAAGTGEETVPAVMAENTAPRDDATSDSLEMAKATEITLDGSTITVNGSGVSVNGGMATITAAGTYSISGALADGQIIVNTTDKAPVKLILNGASLNSSSSAPIYVMKAEETAIILAGGSRNTVSDGKSYVFADPAEEEPNAAIFSKSDLTIYGGGSLTVTGNYNDGIASKDGLVIAGGTLAVTAADDGIRGKDYLLVKDGQITVNAGGDGLKADNTDDATKGYIAIEKGVIDVTAGKDALAAQTDVTIAAGMLTLSAGGGYQARIDQNTSAKGIKGQVSVVIDGGTFTIDAADDALHSNGSVVINGGTFTIAAGDDGIHADTAVKINDGTIDISHSYEGIESQTITINGGDIHLVSSDDGLNVATTSDNGAGMNGMGGPGGRPGRGGGGPGQNASPYTGNNWLYINGGYIVVEADGDGIDINGAVAMTDGVLIVNGPTMQMNGALDYDASFRMTGGFLVAAGSSGMAQTPDASSTQNALLLNFNTTLQAGELVHIETNDGKDVLTFRPGKQYQSIAFSSPDLVQGAGYDVYTQGSSTGTEQDGLYRDGQYTPGTKYESFEVSSVVTTIGGRRR